METRNCNGKTDPASPSGTRYEYGPLRAIVFNVDLGYTFEIEPAASVYTAYQAGPYGGPVWIKPRIAPPVKRSGKVVDVDTETINIGERKEIFGYTARHVITTRREWQGSQLLSESEFDGWYIDPPEAWLKLHPPSNANAVLYVAGSSAGQNDYHFTQKGDPERGFLISAVRTSSRQERQHPVHTEEVTELSEAPLEADLFVPPGNCNRVAQLSSDTEYPWSERLRLYWEMAKDYYSLPGKIHAFIG